MTAPTGSAAGNQAEADRGRHDEQRDMVADLHRMAAVLPIAQSSHMEAGQYYGLWDDAFQVVSKLHSLLTAGPQGRTASIDQALFRAGGELDLGRLATFLELTILRGQPYTAGQGAQTTTTYHRLTARAALQQMVDEDRFATFAEAKDAGQHLTAFALAPTVRAHEAPRQPALPSAGSATQTQESPLPHRVPPQTSRHSALTDAADSIMEASTELAARAANSPPHELDGVVPAPPESPVEQTGVLLQRIGLGALPEDIKALVTLDRPHANPEDTLTMPAVQADGGAADETRAMPVVRIGPAPESIADQGPRPFPNGGRQLAAVASSPRGASEADGE